MQHLQPFCDKTRHGTRIGTPDSPDVYISRACRQRRGYEVFSIKACHFLIRASLPGGITLTTLHSPFLQHLRGLPLIFGKMVSNAVVIPVAVLASICVAMFVFVWWWFPKHYRKGVEQDMDIIDGDRAARNRIHNDMEGGEPLEAPRPKTLEEHIAIARENIRRGHNPAAI